MARNLAKAASNAGHSSERLRLGQQVIETEASALVEMARNLGPTFLEAVDLLLGIQGRLIVTGIGKAGLIGAKLAATFSSTGTPSHFLHPSEAIHGDLGCVQSQDIVLVLSYSGETSEITRLLPCLRQQASRLIAITGSPNSQLAKSADVVLLLPSIKEACFHGLAPSTSTTAMLAMGDALSLVTSHLRGFGSRDFARFHPGGSLGRKLSTCREAMRSLEECRVAPCSLSIREVLIQVARRGRRSGAIMLVDALGSLCGIFTDSDLAKLMESRQEMRLDLPIEQSMTRRFTAIHGEASLEDAMFVLAHRKISELPVVDDEDCPIGMIDITDIIGIVQEEREQDLQEESTDHFPATVRLFDDHSY